MPKIELSLGRLFVSRQRIWQRGVKKYGKLPMIIGLATAPIWIWFYLLVKPIAIVCQKIGDFGDWLYYKTK